MLRTSAQTILSAAALVLLGGCTITTYSSSNPPPPQSQAAQPQSTAAKRPVFRRPANASVSPTPTTPTRTPTTTPDLAPRITSPIIFGNGKSGAFKGYAYVIPETTQRMPDFNSMIPFATLFTDSFNVRTQEFSGGFPGALVQEDWFGIRYEGTLSLPADGSYQFKLVSDDGAVLSIDGQKIVDNDGRHTAKAATGQRDLRSGAHKLRLDYFQALKGTVALQVFIVENGKDTLLVGTK
jgi:hypothetical protein